MDVLIVGSILELEKVFYQCRYIDSCQYFIGKVIFCIIFNVYIVIMKIGNILEIIWISRYSKKYIKGKGITMLGVMLVDSILKVE